jgi:hypothetical protein
LVRSCFKTVSVLNEKRNRQDARLVIIEIIAGVAFSAQLNQNTSKA